MSTKPKKKRQESASLQEVARRAGVSYEDAVALFKALEEELALGRLVRVRNFGIFYTIVWPRVVLTQAPDGSTEGYPKARPAHRRLKFRPSAGLAAALR